VGPSKSSGDLNYIYFTSDSGSDLDFSPMLLDSMLGPQTKGVSAMAVFNNNLYVGFPDTGGQRPYFHKVVNIVENPVIGTDAFDLTGTEMPHIGRMGVPSNGGSIVGIDSFGVFQNKLFLGNGGTTIAETAVLAVEDNLLTFRDKVSGKRGNANAEVDYHSVLKLTGYPERHCLFIKPFFHFRPPPYWTDGIPTGLRKYCE